MADLRSARAAAYENARPELAKHVPITARRVLDLGCEVVGVEVDPAYAADAGARLDRVVTADLERIDWSELGGFDCLIAGDVLEHLSDPWGVLSAAAVLLEPGATAVVSLPNVRYWETFWMLGVRGTFPRRSQGIFDATHLRWFTLADAHHLLDEAGLEVEAVDRLLRRSPEGPPMAGLASRVVGRLPGRTLLTFQHVLRARRR